MTDDPGPDVHRGPDEHPVPDAHSRPGAHPGPDEHPAPDALEEELRQLAAAREPVPPELLAAAEDAFAWRDIDAELAALVYDSLTETGEAALVRGAADAGEQRLFSFSSGDVTVDVEVTRDGQVRSLLGQITPARKWLVDLRGPMGMVTVTTDDLGRFGAERLAPGPLSLRLRPPAAQPRTASDPAAASQPAAAPQPGVVTDWIAI